MQHLSMFEARFEVCKYVNIFLNKLLRAKFTNSIFFFGFSFTNKIITPTYYQYAIIIIQFLEIKTHEESFYRLILF